MPGDDERAGALVAGAAAADEHAALGILAAGDRLDLVRLEHGMPAEDRLQRGIDRLEQRVDRPVADRRLRALLVADDERDHAGGLAAVGRGHVPALEPDGLGDLGHALLDERDEVVVGDLLLLVRERDRLAVDRVERLALELVAELGRACSGGRAGRTACRS